MENQFIRTQILLGQEAMEKLGRSKVAVFGVGGVGGYVAEALARCGVGAFELIDRDQVSVSNLNRQIIATWSTVGMDKTEAMARRIHDINPGAHCQNRDHYAGAARRRSGDQQHGGWQQDGSVQI